MPQNATKALGRRIKAIRLARNWTQAQLAEALSCEPMTISRYERGSYAPSIEVLEHMTSTLGCSMEAFFTTTQVPLSVTNEPSSDELRHHLCDIAYETNDRESLKEIIAFADDVIRRRKQRSR